MAIISLLTDFGLRDAYVGIMKGVILSVNPSAQVVDISHRITPQDRLQAALMIGAAHAYFPPGVVHTVVVDPGVGTDRAVVAVESKGQRFLAPDNGVLTRIYSSGVLERVVSVENTQYFQTPVSQTFQGRDIFAPVAAHLSAGLDMGRLGPEISAEDLVRLDIAEPFRSDSKTLTGTIAGIDRFGNLITNISRAHLSGLSESASGRPLQIIIHDATIVGLSTSYSAVAPEAPLAIMGSQGVMEISVNGASAQSHFSASVGDSIQVQI
ncbi:MAG: SAM-dependent chlorinase/fluorinase [Deltaproteobacteria bacterium]|nr:SAM-dependent chlorinase/fluorinase [Deltaproteobacteria bacterium]